MLSVIICTCRRPESLRRTLQSLAACERPENLAWEVVVVDNAPAAEVESVVAGFREVLPVRYVAEPEPGVSYTRNRGIAESRGEWLWFLDDDVRVSPGWLGAVLAAFQRHAEAGFFGGRIVPRFEGGPPPKWLLGEPIASMPVFGPIGKHDLGEAPTPTPVDSLFGANMGFRREVFRLHGGFRTDFGVAPGWLRGEEHELETRLKDVGLQGLYVPGALVEHLVKSDEITAQGAIRWAGQNGQASANIRRLRRARQGRNTRLRVARDFLKALAYTAGNGALAISAGWLLGPGRRVAIWMRAAQAWGQVVGCFDRPLDPALDWPEALRKAP
jgi:GT2 family glycosyltransferase